MESPPKTRRALVPGAYEVAVVAIAGALAIALVTLHYPGQMSLDSVVALYEASLGKAVGWGPPFFASVLAWLGGGETGAGRFVAINTFATYGVFAILFLCATRAPGIGGLWRTAAAAFLALNPLFMAYAGIVWKDVMLATTAAVATVMMLVAGRFSRPLATAAFVLAVACISVQPLLRQQGILLAVPLSLACAWAAGKYWGKGRLHRRAALAVLAAVMALGTAFSWAAGRTVAKLPASPVSVGLLTIAAYDIIGTVAYARPDDPSEWARAPGDVIDRMRRDYSPERIDSSWASDEVQGYISRLSADDLKEIWLEGIRHDPHAYLTHRWAAYRALLGMESMDGCVPAYWGVAGIPEHLDVLGIPEAMDEKDRFLGRKILALKDGFFFRHWWYAGILALATLVALRPSKAPEIWVVRGALAAAWIYLVSFIPTSIACDFRYLYPMTTLATVIAIYLVTEAPRLRAHRQEEA